ncbi:8-amino-7-oxononanoate synthase [Aeromicrobium sp. CTD01-1L150]|uniref:8-amino-7-oxononanoate synthase n=1 Tax=Aeromicrobium sp. CTD01-1L150 TaxID=3341830 RepID=UPI0035BF0690
MSATWQAWLAQRAEVRFARGMQRHDRVLRTGAVTDLASNDYLGLSQHPRVVEAACAAARRHGASAAGSRLVTGTLPLHHELEARLCDLTGQPSGLVFSTGYAANLGVIAALAGRGSQILLDAHAHASLHDAARVSRAPYDTFAHNDPADLERALAHRKGSRLIVAVESIYSVLGDAAPLRELAEVCARHDALLVVDEAHGIGVAGRGAGLVRELGLHHSDTVVVTVTLSKAIGSQGGAVLGTPALREHLVNVARSFIFDTGLSPANAGAAAAAVELIAEDSRLASAVRANAQIIASTCQIAPAAGAVQSLPLGSPTAAVEAARRLRENGVLVGCFRPPSVPDGISRLRVTARADLAAGAVQEAASQVRDAACDVADEKHDAQA